MTLRVHGIEGQLVSYWISDDTRLIACGCVRRFAHVLAIFERVRGC